MRVLPEPVGPKNSKFPTGRPGEFNPAQNTWYRSTSACTPSSCPTIFARSAPWKSRVSLLRMVGSNWCRAADLISCPQCVPASPERKRISGTCSNSVMHERFHFAGRKATEESAQIERHTQIGIEKRVSRDETVFHSCKK